MFARRLRGHAGDFLTWKLFLAQIHDDVVWGKRNIAKATEAEF